MEHDGDRTHILHMTGSYINQYTMTNLHFGQLFICRVLICYYMDYYWQSTTISAHCVMDQPSVKFVIKKTFLAFIWIQWKLVKLQLSMYLY